MNKKSKTQLFQNQNIRAHWDEENEKWFFSAQDIVQILSESNNVKQYIKKMRSRNTELNTNWGTICTTIE
jgi:prophage antirepressor-like protein